MTMLFSNPLWQRPDLPGCLAHSVALVILVPCCQLGEFCVLHDEHIVFFEKHMMCCMFKTNHPYTNDRNDRGVIPCFYRQCEFTSVIT